jgi:hypothetical protein
MLTIAPEPQTNVSKVRIERSKDEEKDDVGQNCYCRFKYIVTDAEGSANYFSILSFYICTSPKYPNSDYIGNIITNIGNL